MTFKYDTGQSVEYKPMGGSIGLFRVVRHMPEEHGAVDRKYLVKNSHEDFERVVLECDLSPTDNPESMYRSLRNGAAAGLVNK